ncbi:MAG: efflux RND transporter periplasmic adaptor subunit [Candidatus Hydrogenedentes bacterium]|nr:efflux RND transporter periplasmic adaptor subunit [Candidatus Hydrogenedentota bacterium]
MATPAIRSLYTLLLCLLILGLGAGVVGGVLASRQEDPTKAAASGAAATKVVNVRVETLVAAPFEESLLLTGRIDPWEEVLLSAEAAGVIEWQGIEEGQRIAKDQELIRIDTSSVEVLMDQAKARERLTTQELERIHDLRTSGISSPQDYDRALTDRDLAAAEMNAAKTRLSKSVVSAPLDGIVDRLYEEQNEFVDVGKPLVRLVQIERVKAMLGIPERDLPRFHVGDEVQIMLDALPEIPYTGRIYRIATSGDLATRTFLAEIELQNPEARLKPGMTLRARLVRERYAEAIAVPIFAIISLENQRFAVLEKDGLARLQPIEVGAIEGNLVHVTSGLHAGDRLIVEGHRDLREGAAVQVLNGTGDGHHSDRH